MAKTFDEFQADLNETVMKIKEAIRLYGLTAADLDLTPTKTYKVTAKEAYGLGKPKAPKGPRPLKAGVKKGRKQPVRYRGPNGEKWSGQGSQPRWITDSGKPKETFKV